jgi:hypothetical protein
VRCSLTGPWLARSASRSASSAVTAAAGNLFDAIGVHGLTGVWNAVVCTANRADQHSRSTHRRSGDRSGGAVLHSIAVGIDAAFLSGKLLVELVVEEENLAFHSRWIERLERSPAIDDYHLGSKAVRRRGDAAAEHSKNHLLRGAGRHVFPIDNGRRLCAANPMRNGGFLQGDFRAKGTHLCSDVFDSLLRLRRTTDAWADIVREMTQLVERIGICNAASSRRRPILAISAGVQALGPAPRMRPMIWSRKEVDGAGLAAGAWAVSRIGLAAKKQAKAMRRREPDG